MPVPVLPIHYSCVCMYLSIPTEMMSPVLLRKKGKVGGGSQDTKVFVKVWHMNSQKQTGKSYNTAECHNSHEVVVKEQPTDKFDKTFTFDDVYNLDSKQTDVYCVVAKNSEVLSGFSCTIFAYG